jgi:ABC-type lipoprotein export system ATPase subunit
VSLLSLTGVCKRHDCDGRELEVLHDLDLELHAGELVGVWGSPGAGRTTLLRIAAGLDDPSGGTVELCGEDLTRLSAKGRPGLLREAIGWAGGEGPRTTESTTLDYVAEPLAGENPSLAHERAMGVLLRVGLRDHIEDCWDNLDDAERALAEIAHAMVSLPKLLVLDDITAKIRLDEAEYVMDILRSIADIARPGILIATPDMEDLLHVHRIVWLSDGRLLEPRSQHEPGAPGSGAEYSRR